MWLSWWRKANKNHWPEHQGEHLDSLWEMSYVSTKEHHLLMNSSVQLYITGIHSTETYGTLPTCTFSCSKGLQANWGSASICLAWAILQISHTLTLTLTLTQMCAFSITVFLNCLHTFSESMPHILRTLHTNPKKTHTMGKTPQFSCKMKLYIQNNVISSQNGILFSNDTHKPSYV